MYEAGEEVRSQKSAVRLTSRLFLFSFLLSVFCFSAAAQPIIRTTPYTRGLLVLPTAAQCRAYLGITGTNGSTGGTNYLFDPAIFRVVGTNVTLQGPLVLTNVLLVGGIQGLMWDTNIFYINGTNFTFNAFVTLTNIALAGDTKSPVINLGSISGTTNIDASLSTEWALTLSGNLTIGATNWHDTHPVNIRVSNTGNFAVTYTNVMYWVPNGNATQITNDWGVGITDVYHFFKDGGTIYASEKEGTGTSGGGIGGSGTAGQVVFFSGGQAVAGSTNLTYSSTSNRLAFTGSFDRGLAIGANTPTNLGALWPASMTNGLLVTGFFDNNKGDPASASISFAVAKNLTNSTEQGSIVTTTTSTNSQILVVVTSSNGIPTAATLATTTNGPSLSFSINGTNTTDTAGFGSPEGVVPASTGSIYRRLDGTTTNLVYGKTGSGTTGWAPIMTGFGALGTNVVNTIADLVLQTPGVNPMILVKGYFSPNDGGGGIFYLTNTASGTNRGTRFQIGATSQSWQRQAGSALNARWFGAHGDAVTDDTAALQAVMDQATLGTDNTNTIGLQVNIPAGRYLISGPVHLHPGMKIEGEGIWRTQIYQTNATADSFEFTGSTNGGYIPSPIEVKDMHFLGRTDASAGSGLSINGATFETSAKISNVKITGHFNGLKVNNTITSTFSDIQSSFAASTGFKLGPSITSSTFSGCYSLAPTSGNGWYMTNMSYSSFISCASDQNAICGYCLEGCTGLSFLACGTELMNQDGWLLINCNSIALINPVVISKITGSRSAIRVDGGSGVIIENLYVAAQGPQSGETLDLLDTTTGSFPLSVHVSGRQMPAWGTGIFSNHKELITSLNANSGSTPSINIGNDVWNSTNVSVAVPFRRRPVNNGTAVTPVEEEGLTYAYPYSGNYRSGLYFQNDFNNFVSSWLVFKTVDAAGVTKEALRLDKDGRVGISVTNPAVKLDVADAINSSIGYRIANGAPLGKPLVGDGVNFVPSNLDATNISGILPIANGGTGTGLLPYKFGGIVYTRNASNDLSSDATFTVSSTNGGGGAIYVVHQSRTETPLLNLIDGLSGFTFQEFWGNRQYYAHTTNSFIDFIPANTNAFALRLFSNNGPGEISNVVFRATGKTNIVVGAGGTAPARTSDFLYIPTSAGPPTGVPVSEGTNWVAMTFDIVNTNLYIYQTGWNKIRLQ